VSRVQRPIDMPPASGDDQLWLSPIRIHIPYCKMIFGSMGCSALRGKTHGQKGETWRDGRFRPPGPLTS
jgi:hypothetical protein